MPEYKYSHLYGTLYQLNKKIYHHKAHIDYLNCICSRQLCSKVNPPPAIKYVIPLPSICIQANVRLSVCIGSGKNVKGSVWLSLTLRCLNKPRISV